MKRLRILVDLDDVMDNLREAWLKKINVEFKTDIKESELTTWDITKHVKEHVPYLYEPDIYKLLESEWFWTGVDAIPGAAETLEKLQNEGHKIYVLTSTNPSILLHKVNWVLIRYFPFISLDDVIACNHKNLIDGDVLIDDAPHNLIESNLPRLKLMMDAPYNQDVDLDTNHILRVRNWDEIYAEISKLANENPTN